jgi:proteasome lid subunit RPN8/RPN11
LIQENKIHTINLIQNAFSTLLLDAIQYFPSNKKRTRGETHGLFFGITKDDIIECDYVFPVGNVKSRKADEIEHDPKIDEAISSARKLLATSKYMGTYHSHPNDQYFPEWACPSNMDVNYAKYLKDPYMIIIAIARSGKSETPLQIELGKANAYQYKYNKKKDGHDLPDETEFGSEVEFIQGSFGEYSFEVRAFYFDGMALVDANLRSSEALLLRSLVEEKVNIENIADEDIYRLRKMEYNLRQSDEKRVSNFEHHLAKVKGKSS